MKPLATLEGVSKLYGSRAVLRDLSAALPGGSLTLVCGANGAGKSTLLRLLAGLVKPTNGRVVHAKTCHVGYLGHPTFLYPALTAFENLEFWAKIHRANASEKHLNSLLDRVGLRRHAHEPARIFSRGMAQRLNFARVLATDANMLLLDEPFSGLDSQSQTVMRQEIMAMRESGAAIAMVSHAIETDIELADHVIAIKNSRAWTGAATECPLHGSGE